MDCNKNNYSRVAHLGEVLNQYHRNRKEFSNTCRLKGQLASHQVLELLKKRSFLSENIVESQLFENRTLDDLAIYASELYSLYTDTQNLFDKITYALLLSRIFGFYLPDANSLISVGVIPFEVIKAIENQDYEGAIAKLSTKIKSSEQIPEAVLKAIGMAFSGRAFQLMEEEVQNCIRNRKPELFKPFSIARYEARIPLSFAHKADVIKMPVRIELTSCVGSDIFFLAMTRPEKARCINITVDLFDKELNQFSAPIHVAARLIKEKGIRLTSTDLNCSKLITDNDDLFNMRNDDLSLLKAAVIGSGIVPPSVKNNKDVSLAEILQSLLCEHPDYSGFELITRVTRIPRGSGLAVSTNLLAGMIISLMRFSGQVSLGEIDEELKKEAAIRAIFAEWLGGSGGGWQDYGGMWGGFKEISGCAANPLFEKDCNGGLLPDYKEINLPENIANKVLDSMVLVNGGTGQDVGPILRMIAQQYVTKNDIAWNARMSTESRYDEIREALFSGNAQRIGCLEGEDFVDRIRISPLANNNYHENVLKQLSALFGDQLWGYDSTGGRAGAGGVFWVNPLCKDEFEKSFLETSVKIQKNLKGQMHFASEPLVYKFKLNTIGVSVSQLDKGELDIQISNWLGEVKPVENEVVENITDEIKKIYGFNLNLFEKLQAGYRDGSISMVGNVACKSEQIDTAKLKYLMTELPLPGSDDFNRLYKQGEQYLQDPIGYVILNGGESTRYGTHVIRGLNPSIYIDNKYCSPIELKLANIKFVRERYNAKVYPVFVNGYFTENNTKRVLETNNYFGLPEEHIFHCSHEVIHRIVPTVSDLDYWFENIRERSASARDEGLAHQYHETMKNWIKDTGSAEVYEAVGRNKTNTLVSPGHYFSFMSIVTNGVLGKLIREGVKRLVVSSNDNLMATIDPAILALHINKGNKVTSEVVPRLFDRGGAPVYIDGRIQIFEDFRFPDQQTLWNTPYFNPITSWIEISALLSLLELSENDVVNASEGDLNLQKKCKDAVYELALKLPSYPVLKHLNEDMGGGITYQFPVIQFEKLLGDLITNLNPQFLLVPKLMRHTQIKSVDHIYQVYIDKSLEILKSQISLVNETSRELKPEMQCF